MSDNGHLRGAADALRSSMEAVVEAWLERFERAPMRMPGAIERDALRHLVAPTATSLVEAIDGETPAVPGAPALRQTEKALAFLGAALAVQGSTAFDGTALVLALRDALAERAADADERRHLGALFEWFTAVLVEGMVRAHCGAAFERRRELLEERSPVVLVGPEIPAAFPLGDADAHGMRGALARLVLAIARVGARAAIIDAAGLTGAESASAVSALREYCSHRKIRGAVALVVCGLDARAERAWCDVARDAGVELHLTEGFQHAMQVAVRC